ncbi:MAG: V-type ATP synthase subunit F [Actinomycetota bacterium]|nr:V-type ATP synthase subunit F [Actinomycetota bacterium]MDP3630749.1 V-type ATP synthase subunit F [Actinomycetota bacterium]
MARIAIVGDSTSVAGFRPLGFAVYPVERPEDARELWAGLVGGEYGVVFVTEPVYAAVEDLAAEAIDRPIPAVTIIPGAGSSGGVGGAKISRAIERALGTSMLIREEEE